MYTRERCAPPYAPSGKILTKNSTRRLRTLHDPRFNPIDSKGNYNATSNNTKLVTWYVHWPLMGGLLHLVQREGAWAGCVYQLWSLKI